LIDGLDPRGERSPPAAFDHRIDHGRLAFEKRFDRAVAAVTHPTLQPMRQRFMFDKGAVADALHPAVHDDMANDIHAILFRT
jgi:hypothetical protein